MLREKKLYFILVFIALLIQGVLTYKGIESTPFFNYGMFSEITTKKTKQYYVKIDTNELNWNNNYCFNKNVLLYNIENYELAIAGDTQVNHVLHKRLMKLHLTNWETVAADRICNSLSKKEYEQWFFSYLQKEFRQVKSIEVGYYTINNHAEILDKKTLFEYHD